MTTTVVIMTAAVIAVSVAAAITRASVTAIPMTAAVSGVTMAVIMIAAVVTRMVVSISAGIITSPVMSISCIAAIAYDHLVMAAPVAGISCSVVTTP